MNHLPSQSLATVANRALYAFRAGEHLYGADVLEIQEICPCPPITPVPHAPSMIRGLANLRSHIYLALDMRALIGKPCLPLDADCQLIVVKPAVAVDLGIIVERGGDIVRVRADQIEPPPRSGESELLSTLFPQVCRMDGELMTVMQLTALASVVQAQFATTFRSTTTTPRANAIQPRETSQ